MKLFAGGSGIGRAMVVALLINGSITHCNGIALTSESSHHRRHHHHRVNKGAIRNHVGDTGAIQSMTQLENGAKTQLQTAPMLMAQLQSGMHEAKSLARDAIDNDDEEDKKLAKKKVA